ncbi:hypothetical protein TTHERM_000242069 (macronuclear) [Tetrahymena thermophila SB210]|uniref:Uncharacterized protein n=1 Tax=Tetrahymena thermophila (strain SB210) TaxID=312017 RepID=W7X2Y4_TETTS|nr:hypothetical protein TTHERM_000242069 [Tetrahymena thermophila SB210]EWS71797.1 hypothetical protein TTHERM_000242069 [Tetrahymena thermophila SB210]|eukprot:XP_012655684.1 hypothetical protein TTHERM_000242069 [Tetrahymena thermophila SB210]
MKNTPVNPPKTINKLAIGQGKNPQKIQNTKAQIPPIQILANKRINQFFLFQISISYQNKSLLQREERQEILKPIKIKPNIDQFIGLYSKLILQDLKQNEITCTAIIIIRVIYIKKMKYMQIDIIQYDQDISISISKTVKIYCFVDYFTEKTKRFKYQNYKKIIIIIFKMMQASVQQKYSFTALFNTIKVIKKTDLTKTKNIFTINLPANFRTNFQTKIIFSVFLTLQFLSILQYLKNRNISKVKAESIKSNRRQAQKFPIIYLVPQQQLQF